MDSNIQYPESVLYFSILANIFGKKYLEAKNLEQIFNVDLYSGRLKN
jgi:hypothetical protein